MLKSILDNLDGVDDALKPFYKEADGKFAIQVEGMVTEGEVNGLKTALVKERENNGVYKKLGSPDEISTKFADLEAKANAKGGKDADHQAIIDQMKAEHATALKASDNKFTSVLKTTAVANMKSDLAKAGVIPDALDFAANGLQSRIRIDADGTQTILASDGTSPMIGSGANGGATFADLAKELAVSQPFIFADAGKGGGGKQPDNKGGKLGQKTINRTDFDALGQHDRSKFVQDGGAISD